MNNFTVVFVISNSLALLLLRRKYASIPLLIGTCYITRGQVVDFGPFTFSVVRLLLLVGFIRVLVRDRLKLDSFNVLDGLFLLWSFLAIFSSLFHKDFSPSLVFRLGLVYDVSGVYFLFRLLIRSFDELLFILRFIPILLVPIGLEMIFATIFGHNYFSLFGGIPDIPQVRDGSFRAQGPFGHPILAGTVGAVWLPFIWSLRKSSIILFSLGTFSCCAMILTCGSSGPILSAIAGLGALFFWRYREKMSLFRWSFIIIYVFLDIIMKDPAYYLVTRLSVIGGSTPWHRAKLIESAIKHIAEWWFAGTDYTRHWMPTGVSWSPDHTDITNYYLKMGVIGGLPLMFCFISILWFAFKIVGDIVETSDLATNHSQFIIWSLGASLFSIAVTALSVSFFDQSFLFVYFLLAGISSMKLYPNTNRNRDSGKASWPSPSHTTRHTRP